MGQTTNFQLPYPEPSDTPRIPRDMKALADTVDLRLQAADTKTGVAQTAAQTAQNAANAAQNTASAALARANVHNGSGDRRFVGWGPWRTGLWGNADHGIGVDYIAHNTLDALAWVGGPTWNRFRAKRPCIVSVMASAEYDSTAHVRYWICLRQPYMTTCNSAWNTTGFGGAGYHRFVMTAVTALDTGQEIECYVHGNYNSYNARLYAIHVQELVLM